MSGLTVLALGLLGLWATGFSVGWLGFAVPEWSDGRAPELESLIRRHCAAFIKKGKGMGMSVALVTPTNSTLMTFGWPSLLRGQTRADTLFEIGSITKTFTSLVLEREIERGEMRLEQPVQELLPQSVTLPEAAKNVTLRNLVTHTSGFPRQGARMQSMWDTPSMLLFGTDPYDHYTETDLLADVREVKLESPPGTKSVYSNFAMTLLGFLLAKKTGTNYETLVKREICAPLHMDDTTITLDRAHAARFATGYRAFVRCGPIGFGMRSSPWFLHSELGAAGALRSSGGDMLKYLEANRRPKRSPMESTFRASHDELFKTEGQFAYGMNWVRMENKWLGSTLVWHNGGTGGYRSFLGFSEDGRYGVLVLSNTAEGVDSLATDLLRAVVKTNADK